MVTPNDNGYDAGKETKGDESAPSVEPVKNHRSLAVITIALIAIIALSTSTFLLYRENQSIKASLDEQTRKTAELQSLITSFEKLTGSNVTPPISKIQAFIIVLSNDWNGARISEVNATLGYARFYQGNSGSSWSEFLHVVNASVSDYSPRVEYNVTNPFDDSDVGTLWYRYVWLVGVQQGRIFDTIPQMVYFYVDASTGELAYPFPFNSPPPGP
jgi:hypothetical protein